MRPPAASPIPQRPMTASAMTRMPTVGATRSAFCEAIGSATSTAIVTAAIRIATYRARPDRIIQLVRRIGVVEDQVGAATTLVARPARHEERAEEAEHHRGEAGEGQLQEPRRLSQVDLRIDLLDELEEVRALLEDVEERGATDAMSAAYRPMLPPPARAIAVLSDSWRRNGPPTPPGRLGARNQLSALAEPISRRSKATTPATSRRSVTIGNRATEGQSVTPAIGRWWAVQLYQEIGDKRLQGGAIVPNKSIRYPPMRARAPNAMARERPTSGAVANANEPAARISSPYRRTWLRTVARGSSSPGRTRRLARRRRRRRRGPASRRSGP